MKKEWEVKKWEVKKLGEVCSLLAGGDIPKGNFSKTKTTNLQVPVFSNGEKNNGLYGYTSIPRITESSITVSARGTIGFTAKRLEPFFPVVRLIVVTPNDSSSLSLDYLDYCLKTMNFKHSGTSIPQLTVPMIRDYNIPFPPITEQLRIVSILDKAFEAIDKAKQNAEQNLNNAKELFESYLQRVFEERGEGWEETTLGKQCTFTQGIQRDVKLQSETRDNGKVRFNRIIDYTQGNEPPRYIDFPGDKYILEYDDIAIVRYGASTGFVCRGIKGALANNLFRIIPISTNKLSKNYLFIFLQSQTFQGAIKKSMGGAAMPAISFGLIKDIPMYIPTLAEQELIVSKVNLFNSKTQSLESIYQQKLDDLEELKKSILEKAFSGEL